MTDEELELIRSLCARRYNPELEVHNHRRLLVIEVDRLRAENQRLVEACTDLLTEMEHVNVPSLGVLEKLRAAIEGK